MNQPGPQLLLFFLPFVYLIGLGLTAMVSGWFLLSRKYPFRKEQAGERLDEFPLSSVRLGLLGKYNNAVHIDIYNKGVALRLLVFFRPFHAPLFIPWDEMEKAHFGKTFFSAYIDFWVDGKFVRITGAAVPLIARFVKPERHDNRNPLAQ